MRVFEGIINFLSEDNKGIKVFTIYNDEAGKETAITDYESEDILLRLGLPEGTLYDDSQKLPVIIIIKNKSDGVIEAQINRTMLFIVRVSDLN